MPTTFLDGPAAGVGLNLRHAPRFLRVVQNIEFAGLFDALDQPGDEPLLGERVHVYEMVSGSFGCAFICGRGGGGPVGRYEWGVYTHRPDVDGEPLRDTQKWRTWEVSQS